MASRGKLAATVVAALLSAGTAAACSDLDPTTAQPQEPQQPATTRPSERPTPQRSDEPMAPVGSSKVTLAFAGDVHFQLHMARLLDRPRGALGPITQALQSADLTMVNLESAITTRGTPEAKELEVAGDRYYFRAPPAAFDVLDLAGIDVVTMANNHGADYGAQGLADTLAAIRDGPVAVVGIGKDRDAAFAPYRTTVRGTTFAFLAGDQSMREGASSVWAAGPRSPGVAAAHSSRPLALLAAVRAASRQDDVVVVYLHWGIDHYRCPTPQQRSLATALADAGADIVVGSHAHVLLGSGWLGETYVNYGLGNFVWYHNYSPVTGVLQVTVKDARVVDDSWTPALIESNGLPRPLDGKARTRALDDWNALRGGCTDLAPRLPGRGS